MSAVTVDVSGGVGVITIDRPPVNALDAETIAELPEAFAALGADDSVAAIVVRGGGDRAFVAGADIAGFVELDAAGANDLSRRFQRAMDAAELVEKPVIAAIKGYCLGGGLELALACDWRIASDDSLLGVPEVKLGLLPGGGGTQRLPGVVGPGRARMLAYLGEPIAAATAYEWGLVDLVVARAELDDAARESASRCAALPRAAVRELKRLMVGGARAEIASGLSAEAQAFARCVVDPDGREGVAAFLEKREPKWRSTNERSTE